MDRKRIEEVDARQIGMEDHDGKLIKKKTK